MGRTFLAAVLLFSFSIGAADAHRQMTPWLKFAQNNDQQQCQPWQVKDDNGNCVDGPNVFRPGAGYSPGAGESCWAECECYNGQYPAADNCAPCSYLGQVCTR